MSKNPDMWADIQAFHKKFGLEYTGKPRMLPTDLGEFRRKFLDEELTEYKSDTHRGEYFVAMLSQGRADIPVETLVEFMNRVTQALDGSADALVDLVYVAMGTAYLHGFNWPEMWRRVQHANMQKVRATDISQTKRGNLADVVKPEGWVAPSHIDLVLDNVHTEEQE